MEKIYDRTKLLIGEEGLQTLLQANIAIFGVGGVGSYTAEALARAGIGNISLIDHDIIDVTNLNRQIHALISTIGRSKVEVMRERIRDINPKIKVTIFKEFVTSVNIKLMLKERYNYIVDAIDTVSGKISIIEYALFNNIPVISSMGTGNKISNKNFRIADISETTVCPLARVVRKELRSKNIKSGVKVVYSPDASLKNRINQDSSFTKITTGSISYVPSCAGLLIASEIINDLLKKNN